METSTSRDINNLGCIAGPSHHSHEIEERQLSADAPEPSILTSFALSQMRLESTGEYQNLLTADVAAWAIRRESTAFLSLVTRSIELSKIHAR